MNSKIIQIQLCALGYIGDVNLKKVVQLLNVKGGILQAYIVDSITNLGNPDMYSLAYSWETLFNYLPQVLNNSTYVFGIINSPIENNYFSKTTYKNHQNKSVISLHQRKELVELAGRTLEDSIVLDILAAILEKQYESKTSESNTLFHGDTRGDLFDFVANKDDLVYQLHEVKLDDISRGELLKVNVSPQILDTIDKVLLRIKKPTFLFATSNLLENPISSFLLGSLVGGIGVELISSFLQGDFDTETDYWILGILLISFFVLLIGNYIYTLYKSGIYQ